LIEQIYANKETLSEFRFLSFDGRFINQEFIKKLNDCLGYDHFQERNHNLDYLLRFKVLRNLDDILMLQIIPNYMIYSSELRKFHLII